MLHDLFESFDLFVCSLPGISYFSGSLYMEVFFIEVLFIHSIV